MNIVIGKSRSHKELQLRREEVIQQRALVTLDQSQNSNDTVNQSGTKNMPDGEYIQIPVNTQMTIGVGKEPTINQLYHLKIRKQLCEHLYNSYHPLPKQDIHII